MRRRETVVCVPARNEAEHLPLLIRSLGAQTGLDRDTRLKVVVVANNCTDDTLKSVDAAGPFPTLDLRLLDVDLPPGEAHVGTARRIAMDTGAAWLEAEGHGDGVLISTDADAVAPPDWVAANLEALDGADAVGGRLCVDPDAQTCDSRLADLHRRIECYWTGVRALEDAIDPPAHDPSPRHGDHTAASLAVPVAVYRAAGGLPALRCGEDNALVSRIRSLGGRVRHSPDVRIVVSPRLQGRVEGGMASEMTRRAGIVGAGTGYALPSATYWLGLMRQRAVLREAWRQFESVGAGAFGRVDLTAADLAAIDVPSCTNDIAFVERAMLRLGRPATDEDLIDVDTVNADIVLWLAGVS